MTIASAAALAAAFSWSSPQLSQRLCLLALGIRPSLATDYLMDTTEIGRRLADDLSPFLSTPDVQKNLESIGLSSSLLKGVITSATPSLLNTLGNSSADTKAAFAFAPLLLKILDIPLETVSFWITDTSKVGIHFGECKSSGGRAACELTISRASGEQMRLATLWERRSVRWVLTGFVGLSDLVMQLKTGSSP